MAAFHRVHGVVADAQPAPPGERWDYSDGTAPGRRVSMSFQDAEIVPAHRAQPARERITHWLALTRIDAVLE